MTSPQVRLITFSDDFTESRIHCCYFSQLRPPKQHFLFSASCVKGNGRFYQGRVNTTKGGLECQPWYTAKPHAHSSPPPVFPEMRNASNFCRNGGGIESGPWCYTMDPLVRWQHCDIQTCGNK